MKTGGCAVFVGCIAHAVLGSQFLDNAVVDLADGFFLGDFKETATRFFRNPLKNLLAIGARFLGTTLASPATAAARPAATTSRVTTAAPAHSTALLVTITIIAARFREIDGVDHRIGALGGLDRAFQVTLTAVVDAVRENDESLPALLLFH